ncbi:Putative Zn-dependent protease, contains TPR repeats [Pseudomonas sp. 31 R 17]|uniref:Tetratricopeptide repeat protein n=1 Tax=Pseudomonas orientalis TaxID=76758 RepID=A0A4Q7D692_9PSED|nr:MULTISPECIES: tetratricopeptide repeat protein [Pseudomonas]POM13190.1 tetratricopeptide repeat-containing protein [Pseudomonas sp. WP001]MDO4233465.1 tetratricopeptide repeat protein [Pseudomonas sp.]RZI27644.1 tetratricopeptide repeat protein [Pseudomonas orientalis]RZI33811.1 tetratricopeptide repeat protein [Pseudomonas orientalis]CRM01485.1 Putative Zn-dependent protease, contains TPR repeats [Pseudomonas sp. 28 E 9]
MNKLWIPAITVLALLGGCSSVQRGSIPVVDASTGVSNSERISAKGGFRQTVTNRPAQAKPQAMPQDSGVVVMVPGSGAATAAPISAEPWTPGPSTSGPVDATPIQTAPVNQGTYNMPSTPSGIPSSSSAGGLSADEQLDGPVLALLTTAQQQQAGGDLNGASSSLERAQRVAPREPQVLYRLAQVRMAQGDAPQAEQFARRGLSMANGRPDLQASLWALIGDARAAQGDAAGAAQARAKAKVNL